MALRERFFKALHERNAIQRKLARKFLFNAFQQLGFHVTADHFYEIVPNARMVARKYSDTPRPLPGIDWRLAEYEKRALHLLDGYGAEYPEACASDFARGTPTSAAWTR